MIARYDLRQAPGSSTTLDDDGAWVRWNDLRAHVDQALGCLNRDDLEGARVVLAFIVNRNAE